MCATNVEDAIVVGDTATVVILGANLFNIQNTFHLTSNSGSLTVTSGISDPAVNDIKVDAGLTGDASITRITAQMNGKFDIPYQWIPSDHAWTFFTEESDTSANSFQVWGANLVVGHPERGGEFQSGRGSAYSTGYKVLTTDATATGSTSDGANFIDVTTEAGTKTGSTFTFQTNSVGTSLLWAPTRLDENGDTLKDYTMKFSVDTGDTTGSYEFQIWDGTDWVTKGVQATQIANTYRYSSDVFMRSSNVEHVRVGIDDNTTWATKTIDGTTGYWMRTRIASTGSSAPVFEQLALVPSHFMINEKGQRQSQGLALWRETIVSTGNVFGEDGTVVNATPPVGSGGTPTGWNQNMKNNKLNSNGDAILLQFALPGGICTAYPLKFKVLYQMAGSQPVTTAPSGIMSVIPIEVSGVPVADPDGGLVPVPRTQVNTETLTAKAGTAVTLDLLPSGSTLPLDYTNQIHEIEYSPYDISSYYEDDIVAVRFEMDSDGSPNQDVTVWGVIVEGVKFTEGKVL